MIAMGNIDPNTKLARELRKAGIDPDKLASMPDEDRMREGERGVQGLPDTHHEQDHVVNRKDLGTSELQRANAAALEEQVRIAEQRALGQLSPLQRRILKGPDSLEVSPPLREGTDNKG